MYISMCLRWLDVKSMAKVRYEQEGVSNVGEGGTVRVGHIGTSRKENSRHCIYTKSWCK